MDSLLKGLFSGEDDGDQNRSRARDFVDRYETGSPWEGFSGQEAYDNYDRVARQAPPEVYERATERAFNRMSPEQRGEFAQLIQQQMGRGGNVSGDDPRQLAQTVTRMQQEQPGILESLFGGGGGGRSSFGGSSGDPGNGGGGIGGMLDNPLAKVALGGIAAFAFKELMDRDGGGKKRKVVV